MGLKTVVFVSGMSVMIVEILGSRLIAPYFGNSIFVWTSIIGVILASLSLGYYLGGRLADKEPIPLRLSFTLLYAGLLISFIPILSTPVLLLAVPLGLKYGALASSIILLSVPSVLLGFVSPYAVKLETEKLKFLGATVGNLYAISTLGSIIGTFLTGFYLIPHFGVKSILYFVSILLILASLTLSFRKMISYVSAVLIVLALLIFYLAPKTSALEYPGVIYVKDTPYTRIIVKEQGGVRSMFLDVGLQGSIYSNSSESASIYPYFFLASFAVNPDIQNALFLGTGAGVTQMIIRSILPDVVIDSVDIDPDVNNAAKKYFNLVEDENLRLHTGDARYFLAQSKTKYDLIVLDVFSSDPATPPHLVTSQLIGEVKNHLTGDGIFIVNLIGAPRGQYSFFLRSFIKTTRVHFSCIHLLPVDKDEYAIQNVVLLASNSGDCIPRNELQQSLTNLPDNPHVKWSEYDQNMLAQNFPLEDAILLTDDYSPVEYVQLKVSEELLKRNIK